MTDRSGPRFHGSPFELEVLSKGSWVTPFRELARAFSHKPSRISVSDDHVTKVRHNGVIPGFLYVVAEDLAKGDVTVLTHTDETHWQTGRPLQLKFVCDVPILQAELLTDDEVDRMEKKHPGTGYWSTDE